MAIHLPPTEPRRRIVSGPLAVYNLAGCDRLTFKARADKPCRVEVTFAGPSAATAALDVKATAGRKSHALPLKPGQALNRLEFSVPEGVDFWLDNVAFVREAKGPRLGRVALFYEIGKLIHVAVPTLAAFVVFVLLLFVLRVEEAREGWEWLQEKGLKRIVGKFRRKKA